MIAVAHARCIRRLPAVSPPQSRPTGGTDRRDRSQTDRLACVVQPSYAPDRMPAVRPTLAETHSGFKRRRNLAECDVGRLCLRRVEHLLDHVETVENGTHLDKLTGAKLDELRH